jgi:hypothetical protein
MHGRFARYRYTGDAHELARTAEEGMVPIFEAQGGFQAYSILESDGEILSFSAWDTAEGAEAASKAAAEWVAANIADSITLQEVRTGEILLATRLGVSAKAGATA